MVIMTFIRNIVFLSLIVIGCGTPSSFDSKSNIIVNNDTNNTVSMDLNITESIDTIKKYIGDSYIESYTSKDNKDVFTLSSKPFGYSLFHYDVTQSRPVIVNKIVNYTEAKISGIYVLSSGKIIYVLLPPVDIAYVYIYDYILKENIGIFNIDYKDECELYLDPSEKYLLVENYKIDLVDIYKQTGAGYIEETVEQNFRDRLGSDFINASVSKDNNYAFVVSKNRNHGHNLEYFSINHLNNEFTYKNNILILNENELVLKVLALNNSTIAYLTTALDGAVGNGTFGVYDFFRGVSISHIQLYNLYFGESAYISDDNNYIYFSENPFYSISINHIYYPTEESKHNQN